MSDAVGAKSSGPSFGSLVTILIVLLIAAIPACWAAAYVFGVDKATASTVFWTLFTITYFGVPALPWLRLKGSEHLSHAQRLERTCIAWLCLNAAIRLMWDTPWVVFPGPILSAEGELWSYLWWSYMAGGDQRYITSENFLLVLEIGTVIVGCSLVYLLLRYRSARRFSDGELMTLMALMVADLYACYAYFTTEVIAGLQNVGGIAEIIIKFVLTNSPWIIWSCVVFVWAGRQLSRRKSA